jgi:3,5-epimerase/4-reductase
MSDVYLIFGKNGWIGGKLQELLKAQGKTFYLADSRTQNRESVLAEIEKYKPTHVLNAAGVTGRPNVDWCEDNKQETIRANVLGTLTVADICAQKGIHHLLYATGCIFEYDDAHTIGGTGFTEEDSANFHGSFYSHTKVRPPRETYLRSPPPRASEMLLCSRLEPSRRTCRCVPSPSPRSPF